MLYRTQKEIREKIDGIMDGLDANPILLALRRLGVTNTSIAAELGLTDRANFSHYLSGRHPFPAKHTYRLLELLAETYREAYYLYHSGLGTIGSVKKWRAKFKNKLAADTAAYNLYAYEDDLKFANTVLERAPGEADGE